MALWPAEWPTTPGYGGHHSPKPGAGAIAWWPHTHVVRAAARSSYPGVIVMASPQPTGKPAATRLPELAARVGEVAALTKPDAVVWCDGSQAEWARPTSLLLEAGTFHTRNPGLRPT